MTSQLGNVIIGTLQMGKSLILGSQLLCYIVYECSKNVFYPLREYANMASVRYIDFDSPKGCYKPRPLVRSQPELIETEPAH